MFNVTCPDCFSKNLYKFGFEPKHNLQKYFCKDCERQFTERSFSKSLSSSKYPKCPICGKCTFLHHDYLYYSNFTCNDKSCAHSFNLIKDSAIKKISSHLIDNTQVKRLRTKLHIIVDALYLYFINNSTTRAISNFFKDRYNFYISHVSIYKWIIKFASVFKSIADSLFPTSLHLSDEWHVDETIINIHGKRHYIWTLIDSETRFVIDYHLSPSREASDAFALFNAAKLRFGSPKSIVSDRLPSYTFPVKSVFSSCKHIKVQKFSGDITNNLIESFFSKFKAHHKAHRGLKSFASVNRMLYGFFFCYNFIRPHGSLNSLTPAQVAGVLYSETARRNLLLF
jgi:transposase-like protein/DNA-directed RNA polymerase subunit RPC12/RpoP